MSHSYGNGRYDDNEKAEKPTKDNVIKGYEQHLQVVTLVLSDQRRISYTGRVQVGIKEEIRVVDIIVSKPIKMPDGCSFSDEVFSGADIPIDES